MPIVIIVDTDRKEYYDHHIFDTVSEASSFAEGMEAAWKISHGYANCWRPYVLDFPHDFQEWEEMGSPGKTEIQ